VPHLSPTNLTSDEQRLIPARHPSPVGRYPITERKLRPIVVEPLWQIQMETWRALVARLEARRRLLLLGKRTGEEDLATARLREFDDVQ
jgi:hypothetical protein